MNVGAGVVVNAGAGVVNAGAGGCVNDGADGWPSVDAGAGHAGFVTACSFFPLNLIFSLLQGERLHRNKSF